MTTPSETSVASHFSATVEGAIRPVGGRAAVFSVDPPSRIRPFFITSGATDIGHPADLEALALDALRAGKSVRHYGRDERDGTDTVVLPAFVEEELVALVVLVAPELALPICIDRLGPILLPLALGVDHHRTRDALAQRGAEVTALRQQLDVYALDFRSTYRAERDRTQELANALSELEETYLATVQGLAIAVEAKDECTGGHLQRVSRYGMMLTRLISPDHANDVQFEYGFLLHDIGKLTVPDVVLTKEGPLTDAEWTLMREHPTSGRSILSGIPFLAGAREIVFAHHERWDGRGYPRGLIGDGIPLGAQIFPLCDAFDAMTSDRPYRQALPVEEALAQIREGRGTQFRPDAVDAFLSISVAELDSVRAGNASRSF